MSWCSLIGTFGEGKPPKDAVPEMRHGKNASVWCSSEMGPHWNNGRLQFTEFQPLMHDMENKYWCLVWTSILPSTIFIIPHKGLQPVAQTQTEGDGNFWMGFPGQQPLNTAYVGFPLNKTLLLAFGLCRFSLYAVVDQYFLKDVICSRLCNWTLYM